MLLPLSDAPSSLLLAVSAIDDALVRRRLVVSDFGISFPSPLELLSMIGSAQLIAEVLSGLCVFLSLGSWSSAGLFDTRNYDIAIRCQALLKDTGAIEGFRCCGFARSGEKSQGELFYWSRLEMLSSGTLKCNANCPTSMLLFDVWRIHFVSHLQRCFVSIAFSPCQRFVPSR